MGYVVLDTDVASLSFRGRLPGGFARPLAGKITCVSFVTIGEMTKWAELRDWSPRTATA
jgi:toxin FitB